MTTGNSRSARPVSLAVLCCAALSGCMGNGEGFSFGALTSAETSETRAQSKARAVPHRKEATLARGTIRVKAPKDYCIEDRSLKSSISGSSAVLAKCTSLTGKGADPARAAVMTLTISPRRGAGAAAADVKTLRQAVAPARVLAERSKGDVVMVQVASGGEDIFATADPKHWRGATVLDTRLVLLGVYAPKGGVMAGRKGADLIPALARGLSVTRTPLINAATKAETAAKTQATQTKDAKAKDADEKKGLNGLFGRLFKPS